MHERIAAAEQITRSKLSATALPWGSLEALQRLDREHRRPTLILCSDLIYFRELFAPLLRTLLWLTRSFSQEHSEQSVELEGPKVIMAYKIRCLAREEVFYKAFCEHMTAEGFIVRVQSDHSGAAYWFDFAPVLVKAEGEWRSSEDGETYIFEASRRIQRQNQNVPTDDQQLLDLTDDTFERILFSNLEL